MPRFSLRPSPSFVAAIAHVIVSLLRFNAPLLFADEWLEAIGRTAEQVAADFTPLKIVFGLLVGLAVAFALDQRLHLSGSRGLVVGRPRDGSRVAPRS